MKDVPYQNLSFWLMNTYNSSQHIVLTSLLPQDETVRIYVNIILPDNYCSCLLLTKINK